MSINYSIAMLGNPIDEDAPKKAYAKSQYTNILTLDKFAGHIASPRNPSTTAPTSMPC